MIWLSGFIWEDDFHKSWASTFPHYIRRLYPNARVFLIRRDSRFTVGKKVSPLNFYLFSFSSVFFLSLTPLFSYSQALSYGFTIFELLLSSKGTIRAQLITEPPHPPSLPMWADVEVPPRFISHQVSFSQDPELAPDIHIIRNSFQIIDRILYYAPWLLPSSAFRVVFPIPDIGNQTQTGNYVDYIVHADEMLKVRTPFLLPLLRSIRVSSSSHFCPSLPSPLFLPLASSFLAERHLRRCSSDSNQKT